MAQWHGRSGTAVSACSAGSRVSKSRDARRACPAYHYPVKLTGCPAPHHRAQRQMYLLKLPSLEDDIRGMPAAGAAGIPTLRGRVRAAGTVLSCLWLPHLAVDERVVTT